MNPKSNINPFFFSTETSFFTHIVDGDDYITHKHLHYEIFYITSGTIVHNLNGEFRTLTMGDMVFLSPEDSHNFIRPSNALHRDVIFTEELLKKVLASADFRLEEFKQKIQCKYFHLTEGTIALLEKLLKQHLTSYFRHEKSADLISYTSLSILCLEILLMQSNQAREENKVLPEWLTTVIERFNNLMLIQQGLPAILEGVHYNKTYVNRTFKKYFGMSLSDYLSSTRLNYALYYLKNSKYSNEEISNLLGFSSPSYFYKLFKKQINISPNAYRKQHASS